MMRRLFRKRSITVAAVIFILNYILLSTLSPLAEVYAVDASVGEPLSQEMADTGSNTFVSDNLEGWPVGPVFSALSAVVIDIDTGVFLFGKDPHGQYYPASITKVMTALLAVENGTREQTVTFSHDAIFNIEAGSANVGMKEGEIITLDEALRCLMCASANECAYAIAETIGGTYDQFIVMMNEKATELGCTDSHFVNPHGLYDPAHYISAYDMALIASAAYQNEWFREVCGLQTYNRPVTEMVNEPWLMTNHHKMFQPDSPFFYEGCTGGKTGWTTEAHNTLVTFAERDGMRLCCVLLHGDGANVYEGTTALLDFCFSSFSHIPFADCFEEDVIQSVEGTDFATIPTTMTAEDLRTFAVQQNDIGGTVSVYYQDCLLGGASVTYTDTYLEKLAAMEPESPGEESEEESESQVNASSNAVGFWQKLRIQAVQIWNSPNRFYCIVGVALVVVLILLVLTRNKNKKKHK